MSNSWSAREKVLPPSADTFALRSSLLNARTATTPAGNPDGAFDLCRLVAAAGATHVARYSVLPGAPPDPSCKASPGALASLSVGKRSGVNRGDCAASW